MLLFHAKPHAGIIDKGVNADFLIFSEFVNHLTGRAKHQIIFEHFGFNPEIAVQTFQRHRIGKAVSDLAGFHDQIAKL